MKRSIILPFFMFMTLSMFAQTVIYGDVHANDTVTRIMVTDVQVGDFPTVDVSFKATIGPVPKFNLGASDVTMIENGDTCQIDTLQNISQQQSLHIAVVIDRSTSMIYGMSHLKHDDFIEQMDAVYEGDYSLTPLHKAKQAVIEMLDQVNFDKDKIAIFGFSDTVTCISDFSSNKNKLIADVEGIEPIGYTSFYDGVYEAGQSFQEDESINIIIVLTDGADDTSSNTPENVAKMLQQKNIQLYTIGMGEVDRNQLENLNILSRGVLYYTESADALASIYENVQTYLDAMYQLTYQSPHPSTDSMRNIAVSFKEETGIRDNSFSYVLPRKEIIEYQTAEIRKEKWEKIGMWSIFIGCIMLLVFVGFGHRIPLVKVIPKIPRGIIGGTLAIAGIVLQCIDMWGIPTPDEPRATIESKVEEIIVLDETRGQIDWFELGDPAPNPTTGKVRIPYIYKGGAAQLTYGVVSNAGAIVGQITTIAISESSYIEVDLTNEPAGTYHFSFLLSTSEIMHGKTVIKH